MNDFQEAVKAWRELKPKNQELYEMADKFLGVLMTRLDLMEENLQTAETEKYQEDARKRGLPPQKPSSAVR